VKNSYLNVGNWHRTGTWLKKPLSHFQADFENIEKRKPDRFLATGIKQVRMKRKGRIKVNMGVGRISFQEGPLEDFSKIFLGGPKVVKLFFPTRK